MKKIMFLFMAMAFLLAGGMAFAGSQEANSKKNNTRGYLSASFGSANTSGWGFDDGLRGHELTDIAVESGFVFAFSGGIDRDSYRLEAEVSMQNIGIESTELNGFKKELSGASLSMTSIMGNFYYNINLSEAIKPFVMGGLGAGFGSLKDFKWGIYKFENDPTWIAFAYQIGAGLSFHFTEHFALDASYRYFNSTDGSFTYEIRNWPGRSGKNDAKIKAKGINNFIIGLRYSF